jgi:hypothetical protein
MDRTKRYEFETPRYSYGELEQALGAVFNADQDAQRGALRGRLKRLSTLGLLTGGPGKGSRRRYSWEEANQLLIALMMGDAGLDPVVIVQAIKAIWPKVAHRVAAATSAKARAGNPMLLVLQLQSMSGPFRTGNPLSAVPWIGVMPLVDERARAKQKEHGFRDTSNNILTMFEQTTPNWLAVRDLTAAADTMLTSLHGSV